MVKPVAIDIRDIARGIDAELWQVAAVIDLLERGNTVPFITRFRRDQTGGLDEERIRQIQSRLSSLRLLAERKQTILRSIEAQGKLTPELEQAILAADSASRLEDLYVPFKPKKQTLATLARARGLEKLAEEVLSAAPQCADLDARAVDFVSAEKGVHHVADALAGAGHIIAEQFSERADLRQKLRDMLHEMAVLVSTRTETAPPPPPPPMAPSERATATGKPREAQPAPAAGTASPGSWGARRGKAAVSAQSRGGQQLTSSPQEKPGSSAATGKTPEATPTGEPEPSVAPEKEAKFTVGETSAVPTGSDLQDIAAAPGDEGRQVPSEAEAAPQLITGSCEPLSSEWVVGSGTVSSSHVVSGPELSGDLDWVAASSVAATFPSEAVPAWELTLPAVISPETSVSAIPGVKSGPQDSETDQSTTEVEVRPAETPASDEVSAAADQAGADPYSIGKDEEHSGSDISAISAEDSGISIATVQGDQSLEGTTGQTLKDAEPKTPASPTESESGSTGQLERLHDPDPQGEGLAIDCAEKHTEPVDHCADKGTEPIECGEKGAGSVLGPDSDQHEDDEGNGNGNGGHIDPPDLEPEDEGNGNGSSEGADGHSPQGPPREEFSEVHSPASAEFSGERAQADLPEAMSGELASMAVDSGQAGTTDVPTGETPSEAGSDKPEIETPAVTEEKPGVAQPVIETELPPVESGVSKSTEELAPGELSPTTQEAEVAAEASDVVTVQNVVTAQDSAVQPELPHIEGVTAPEAFTTSQEMASSGTSSDITSPQMPSEERQRQAEGAEAATDGAAEAIAEAASFPPLAEEALSPIGEVPSADLAPVETQEAASLEAGDALAEETVLTDEATTEPTAERVAPPATAAAPPAKKVERPQAGRGKGRLDSQEKRRQEFADYFDFREKLTTIPAHRVLAIHRGQRLGVLRVKLEYETTALYEAAETMCVPADHPHAVFLRGCLRDALTRLLLPALERELMRELLERAEAHVLKVFARNLRDLLLQPPVRNRRVLAIDPGIRSGCPVVALDEFGNLLEHGKIFLVGPSTERGAARELVCDWVNRLGLTLIAIGNGTGSRQVEYWISGLIAGPLKDKQISYVIVDEAGSSSYSVSAIGREEFPDLPPEVRSAISIGRRLLDPLSELVKIDPANLGVGLYQHDIKPVQLRAALDQVVESCVNFVGVNVNTASISLLRYVSGLNQLTAKGIYAYRQQNGPFRNREQLRQVPGIGDATFVQAAGFLFIPDGDNPLDGTSIHPESYPVATRLLELLGFSVEDLRDKERAKKLREVIRHAKLDELTKRLEVGELLVKDLLSQLARPGHDPREDFPGPIFRQGVLKLSDLKPGMELCGKVANIVDFGAFVDFGLPTTGLVHISALSTRYVKDPYEVVDIGCWVRVWVLDVDRQRNRVSLTMIPPGTPRGRAQEPRKQVGRPPGESKRREGGRAPREGKRGAPSSRPVGRVSPEAEVPAAASAVSGSATEQAAGAGSVEPAESPPAPARYMPSEPERAAPSPPPERRQPPRTKRAQELPRLSEAVLRGKRPMRSFSELAQFFRIKESQEQGLTQSAASPAATSKPDSGQQEKQRTESEKASAQPVETSPTISAPPAAQKPDEGVTSEANVRAATGSELAEGQAATAQSRPDSESLAPPSEAAPDPSKPSN